MRTKQTTTKRLENADRIWHLQHTAFMKGLSPTDLQVISETCADRIYPRGKVIFYQGNPAHYFYLLNRGHVRISTDGPHQKEKILDILRTGDVFGENILGPQDTYQCQATAHDECWVSVMSRESLDRLLRQRPALYTNLVQILNGRISQAHRDLLDVCALKAEDRVGKTLLRLGANHGQPVLSMPNFIKLRITITHEQIATLVGANRPHVSTIMAKFRRRGWLDYEKNRLLIEAEKLQSFLGLGKNVSQNSHHHTTAPIGAGADSTQPVPIVVPELRQKIRALI